MYCSEFEITFMYVNLELDGTLLHMYTHHLHVRVAKQNLFFLKLYQFVQNVNFSIPV